MPDWIGILGVGGGIMLVIYRASTAPAFFRNEKREKFGDEIVIVTSEAEFAPADTML